MLAGITTSNTQQNMYAMAASGSRRKKRTAKIAKKKLPKRRRRSQVKIKKRQRRIIKRHAKKRYRKRKVKPHKRRVKGLNSAERKAKAWIAWHESRNRWYVSNGYCYGKYQLMPSYLHGDYSPANQTRAADHYVHSRYGTWQHAKYFWQVHHWY